MRLSIFCLALLVVTGFAPAAFALTLDHESGLNADGSSKFSDPDDQKPGFMTPLSGGPSAPAGPNVGLPMSQGDDARNAHMNFSVNRFGDGPQTNAFDQAYGSK